MATSWAALRGEPPAEIYAVASRSAPCEFSQFYRFSVATMAPLGPAALSAAGGGKNGVLSIPI